MKTKQPRSNFEFVPFEEIEPQYQILNVSVGLRFRPNELRKGMNSSLLAATMYK